jgi:hypothetical protein
MEQPGTWGDHVTLQVRLLRRLLYSYFLSVQLGSLRTIVFRRCDYMSDLS